MHQHRAIRQKLEDLRRAGVTHLPAAIAQQVTAALQPSVQQESSGGAPPRKAPLAARKPPGPPAPVQPSPVAAASSVNAAPRSTLTRCTLSRDERIAQLNASAEKVAACVLCPELARTRTKTVFGVGNPEAKIIFIGEAPGAEEDLQGIPFVGAAGQLLDKIIVAAKLTREEIYICNVLKCRPPGNRTPSQVEADNCRQFLDVQIATINPEYIVCWGSVAAQNLLATKQAIGKLRGRFHDHQGIPVLCTYHPSYLLRNPAAKKDVWEDMKVFRKAMGVELT